jgi:ribosomal protein L7/L12
MPMTDMQNELSDIKARLERIEAQLLFLFRRLGITTQDAPAAQASPAVMELVRNNDKKGAIRAFMQETGAGLKDAKIFIESLRGE